MDNGIKWHCCNTSDKIQQRNDQTTQQAACLFFFLCWHCPAYWSGICSVKRGLVIGGWEDRNVMKIWSLLLDHFKGCKTFFYGVWMLNSTITRCFEEWLWLMHTYKLMLAWQKYLNIKVGCSFICMYAWTFVAWGRSVFFVGKVER
jgi:hypothetical protein